MVSDRLALLLHARLRVSMLVVAGVLGALAFPRSDAWLFAWVWLAPALACALARSPRGALADGWLSGTAFFVVLLRWLDYTFTHYSAIPWPLGWLPLGALAAYCGLYTGAVTAAVAWLKLRLGAGCALAAAPLLWVAGEWIRGHLMGGFPWGLMGYSQHGALPVIQIAELGGVYAVSFLVVAVNAGVAGVVGLGGRRALPGALGAAVLLALSLGFGASALRAADGAGGDQRGALDVAVIQPSVEQTIKWDPARHAETIAIHERLTREAARDRPALIVWPETAAAIFLRGDPELLARLTALSAELATPLLVGSVDRQEGPVGKYLNSAFLLTGQGIRAKYDKIHLVPFGEYVPLGWLIGFVRSWAEFISDFAAGKAETVFHLPGTSFGTVICYEVIFPELFRGFVAGGAGFMVNITNDAWFGETSGPWQHLGMLPLRAVEHRVWIARAANTGISGFVEPSGRVTRMLPLFERGVAHHRMALRGRATLYTRAGDWLAYGCLALGAAVFGLAVLRRPLGTCSAN
ncbi:MAG TPA: apolipoprotein N-acyltransferase [Methylomirabilota bacterium]|jgi:apolipoprotein N-acyltransferase|nr:apolipoprotein N-acyltransferase [Methylomirabilota bacterium]